MGAETIIKIKQMTIRNIKNIKTGKFETNATFENLAQADILGFYGQNGSGKTALVEAFSILKVLLSGESLQKKSPYTVFYGEKTAEVDVVFLLVNKFGEYKLQYTAILELSENQLAVQSETLAFCENQPAKRSKVLVSYQKGQMKIRNKNVMKFSNQDQLPFLIGDAWAQQEKVSFIFQEKIIEQLAKFLEPEEFELIAEMHRHYAANLYIIDNQENGYVFGNIIIPFNVHYGQHRGKLAFNHEGPTVIPETMLPFVQKIIEQTNIVMTKIIPGLQIILHTLGKQTLDNGEQGVNFELLAHKHGIQLPLACESAGTLKLISIVGTLIAVFNKPSACIVIDELDSGVFEYLLGEILTVLDLDGKGQFIFTSHNLRVLEVLENKKLWFTTMNPNNRFVQMTGIQKNSNIRDVYLRTVQLGGQSELLYLETDSYDIKKAFRKAGE
ncbi:MAG: AAA family ATPase [Culicoidibacterales bacterium]